MAFSGEPAWVLAMTTPNRSRATLDGNGRHDPNHSKVRDVTDADHQAAPDDERTTARAEPLLQVDARDHIITRAQELPRRPRLAGQGVAVILVSHNMNDVMKVADSIAVLYLGRMAAQVRRKEVTQTQVVELITAGRSGDLGLPPAESYGAAA